MQAGIDMVTAGMKSKPPWDVDVLLIFKFLVAVRGVLVFILDIWSPSTKAMDKMRPRNEGLKGRVSARFKIG